MLWYKAFRTLLNGIHLLPKLPWFVVATRVVLLQVEYRDSAQNLQKNYKYIKFDSFLNLSASLLIYRVLVNMSHILLSWYNCKQFVWL